ncbi:hypothetical protein, partial [Xenorhabdus bovienii]|uniref:hypothetical protein n=1 Tax=Xenorhabdus bovienii TaxID=40576 RepID=UPI0023B2881D
ITGELITGVKVSLATEPDTKSADSHGYLMNEISAPFNLFQSLVNNAKDLVGKLVTVSCDVKLNGRFVKLSAVSIRSGL